MIHPSSTVSDFMRFALWLCINYLVWLWILLKERCIPSTNSVSMLILLFIHAFEYLLELTSLRYPVSVLRSYIHCIIFLSKSKRIYGLNPQILIEYEPISIFLFDSDGRMIYLWSEDKNCLWSSIVRHGRSYYCTKWPMCCLHLWIADLLSSGWNLKLQIANLLLPVMSEASEQMIQRKYRNIFFFFE